MTSDVGVRAQGAGRMIQRSCGGLASTITAPTGRGAVVASAVSFLSGGCSSGSVRGTSRYRGLPLGRAERFSPHRLLRDALADDIAEPWPGRASALFIVASGLSHEASDAARSGGLLRVTSDSVVRIGFPSPGVVISPARPPSSARIARRSARRLKNVAIPCVSVGVKTTSLGPCAWISRHSFAQRLGESRCGHQSDVRASSRRSTGLTGFGVSEV